VNPDYRSYQSEFFLEIVNPDYRSYQSGGFLACTAKLISSDSFSVGPEYQR